MRKSVALVFVFVLALAAAAQAITAYRSTGFVNDFAGILPSDVAANLEWTLGQYEQKTSVEVSVVTVPSLEGLTIEEFASELFRSWGIGKKGKDNGVLLLVAPNEHRVRIEVGYGLEPDLTDLQSKEILSQQVTPRFKEGKFSEGIVAGATGITAVLGDTPFKQRQEERARTARQREADQGRGLRMALTALGSIAGSIIMVIVVGRVLRRHEQFQQVTADNLSRQQGTADTIARTEQEYSNLAGTVNRIKDQHTPNAWHDLFPETSAPALRQELHRISQEPARTLKQAFAVNVELRDFQRAVTQYSALPARVTQRVKDLEQAVSESFKMRREQPDLLVKLQKASAHPDVTPKTAGLVAAAAAKIRGAWEVWIRITPCDYLSTYAALVAAQAAIKEAQDGIDNDKTFAVKARAEGPALLASLPEKLSEAEKVVDHKDVSATSSGLITEAKRRLVAVQQTPVKESDWVRTFIELYAIAALIGKAIANAKSDKQDAERRRRRRRRSSSSSYGSFGGGSGSFGSSSGGGGSFSGGSDSGGGFGGFGGGSSGGGGASDSW